MLRLICEGAEASHLQSRVAILDIDHEKYDFGFAAGHAIPPERPCKIRDFNRRSKSVDLIKFADSYQSGEKTDWAIIRFKKISTKGLVRYQLEPVEDLALLDQKTFSFAQARGRSENAQNCNLTELNFHNGRQRITHDCKAIPGQSGSPVTQLVDGKHKLIGLHIGQLWMLESPETGRPDRRGYINLLDVETVNEIKSVILENQI